MNQLISHPLKVMHITLQNTHYAIDLPYIKKILPLPSLDAVPGGADYIVGLMNFAGKSIPIIDLALRLGLARDEPYTLDMPIVLCGDEVNIVGVLVDKVIGLVSIKENALQMQPEFKKADSPFLASIELNSELMLLINMDYLLCIDLGVGAYD